MQIIFDKIINKAREAIALGNEIVNLSNPWTNAISNVDTIIEKLYGLYEKLKEINNLVDEFINSI